MKVRERVEEWRPEVVGVRVAVDDPDREREPAVKDVECDPEDLMWGGGNRLLLRPAFAWGVFCGVRATPPPPAPC